MEERDEGGKGRRRKGTKEERDEGGRDKGGKGGRRKGTKEEREEGGKGQRRKEERQEEKCFVSLSGVEDTVHYVFDRLAARSIKTGN
jgi:hypothetical protein